MARLEPRRLFSVFPMTTSMWQPNSSSAIQEIAEEADGDIVAVGNARNPNNSAQTIPKLARYSADGTFQQWGANVLNGMQSTSFNAIKIQADGKIVVVGSATPSGSSWVGMLVARFNPDFTLDTTFGGAGYITLFPKQAGGLLDVDIQADGKIVAVGSAIGQGTGPDRNIYLVRYNPNGTLDQTFLDTYSDTQPGVVRKQFGEANQPYLWRASEARTVEVVDVNGTPQIYIGGYVVSAPGYNQHWNFYAAKFGATGQFLYGFETDMGPASLEFDVVNDLVVDYDGPTEPTRVILAGTTGDQTTPSDFAVATVVDSGVGFALDPSFDSDGKLVYDIGSADWAHSVDLDPDEKILIGGTTSGPTNSSLNFYLTRLHSNGAVDWDFGHVIVDFNGGRDESFGFLQRDDDVIIAGLASRPAPYNTSYDFALYGHSLIGDGSSSFGSNAIAAESDPAEEELFFEALDHDLEEIVSSV